MKIKLQLLLWSLALVLVSACSDDKKPELGPLDKGEERTVLAYWIGENDLSDFAKSDFNEMMEGVTGVDTKKNNLVVYCDTQGDLPRLIHVSKRAGKVVADTIYTYPTQNSLKKEVMSEIISRVMIAFPAKSYGLVLASHADGWIEARKPASTRHFGDYNGTQMDIPLLREALETLPVSLEFILFDACYMQAIEVAYELRNVTNYVISSPTEIPGPGAPYQKVVPFLFSSAAAVDIAQAYYNYYGHEDGSIKTDATFMNGNWEYVWDHGVSVSVIKTSELEELAEATSDILSRYAENKVAISTYSLFNYGYAWGKDDADTDYYDLKQLIAKLTSENPDYDVWNVAFEKAQPYFKTTRTCYAGRKNPREFSMAEANGITTFIPQSGSPLLNFYQTLQWYKEGNVWQSSGW